MKETGRDNHRESRERRGEKAEIKKHIQHGIVNAEVVRENIWKEAMDCRFIFVE